jgi:hypothetical protein
MDNMLAIMQASKNTPMQINIAVLIFVIKNGTAVETAGTIEKRKGVIL